MLISDRGQITIPKHLQDRFGMNHNVEVAIIPTEQALLAQKLTLAKHPVNRISGILDNRTLGDGGSVDDYIEETRGR